MVDYPIASPRPIRFVMLRDYYETPIKPFLKFFGAIPISRGQSNEALKTVAACLTVRLCVSSRKVSWLQMVNWMSLSQVTPVRLLRQKSP